MWSDAEKATFVAQAFQEVHATSRAIRDRLYSIVNYSATVFLVTAAFFLTQAASVQPHIKIAAGIATVFVIAAALALLKTTFGTLMKQQHILASLEKAMELHTIGVYGVPGKSLYPSTAPIENLTNGSYYHETMRLYRVVVVLFGSIAIASILVSLYK